MSALAAIRPDEWNLPLFLHILGAMVMVGALVLAAVYLVPAWRGASADSLRLGFRSLLWAALPAFIVMRASAQWLYDEEGLADVPESPGWIDIGFITSDAGLVVLLVGTVVAGLGMRRAADGGGSAGARVATVCVALLIVLYLVAIWAMTTKPA